MLSVRPQPRDYHQRPRLSSLTAIPFDISGCVVGGTNVLQTPTRSEYKWPKRGYGMWTLTLTCTFVSYFQEFQSGVVVRELWVWDTSRWISWGKNVWVQHWVGRKCANFSAVSRGSRDKIPEKSVKRGLEILTLAKAEHLGREAALLSLLPGVARKCTRCFFFLLEVLAGFYKLQNVK